MDHTKTGVHVAQRIAAKKEGNVERMKSKLFAVLFCFTLILLITNSDGFSGTIPGKRGVFRKVRLFLKQTPLVSLNSGEWVYGSAYFVNNFTYIQKKIVVTDL